MAAPGHTGPATPEEMDLEFVKKLLPAGQDANDRAVRQTLFEMWKKPGKKTLSLDDVKAGVDALLVDYRGEHMGDSAVEKIKKDMMASVSRAFKAARGLSESKRKKKRHGGKNKRIDAVEFHAFLATLQHYIEIAFMFESMDDSCDDNQKLSLRECKTHLARLEKWGIDESELEEKFKGVDSWTSKLGFLEFADWLIKCRWGKLELELDDSEGEEVLKEQAGEQMRKECGFASKTSDMTWKQMTDIFYRYDSDGNGQISLEELQKVIVAMSGGSFWTPEKMESLFHAADSDHDGQVDYEEFCRWLFVEE
mmetsp:Transcript_159182/g.296728  ORF Transcript_159182/g.296728 Transcript_159182/m.296728 type:complete len:309 (-) Transcript_159182:31-957(-)